MSKSASASTRENQRHTGSRGEWFEPAYVTDLIPPGRRLQGRGIRQRERAEQYNQNQGTHVRMLGCPPGGRKPNFGLGWPSGRGYILPVMGGGISKTQWRRIKRLLHGRGRAESGRLLVEGGRAVQAALQRKIPPEQILVGPDATDFALDVLESAKALGVPVADLSSEQISELSTTAHPQELIALVAWLPQPELPDTMPPLSLHLSGIRNPANLGALLRTAAAFDVAVTCSPDCVDPTHPVAVRSGTASYFELTIVTNVLLKTLKEMAPEHDIISVAAHGGEDLSGFVWRDRTILVLGGEAEGATEPLHARTTVTIPSRVESLNVAVAGGILLWDVRQKGTLTSS